MIENIIDAPVKGRGNYPRAVLVEIKELHELSRLVRTLGTGRWIFRGHGDKDWMLASSLERQFVKNGCNSINKIVHNVISATKYDKYRESDELYAIDLFKRHARTRLPQLEHLVEWLAAMQHYGTSTRLLDFTRSIYVALYFAFENKLQKTDVAIYAIQYSDLLHSDTLSKELIKDQQGIFLKKKVKGHAHIDVEGARYIEENFYNNRKELQDSLIKLADQCIERRSNRFGIIPVNVPGVNERLVAQSGLFLLPMKFASFTSNLSASLNVPIDEITKPHHVFNMASYPMNKTELQNATLVKIVIPRSMSDAMRNMLAQANVSALNLFPGLDGIAKSIRYDEPLYE